MTERYVQEVQDGMRVLLFRAGLLAAFWPEAATCYVMLCNIKYMTPRQDTSPDMANLHARTGGVSGGNIFLLVVQFILYRQTINPRLASRTTYNTWVGLWARVYSWAQHGADHRW